jgi:hypothetical protein
VHRGEVQGAVEGLNGFVRFSEKAASYEGSPRKTEMRHLVYVCVVRWCRKQIYGSEGAMNGDRTQRTGL